MALDYFSKDPARMLGRPDKKLKKRVEILEKQVFDLTDSVLSLIKRMEYAEKARKVSKKSKVSQSREKKEG